MVQVVAMFAEREHGFDVTTPQWRFRSEGEGGDRCGDGRCRQ